MSYHADATPSHPATRARSLTRVTKSYLLALGTTQISSIIPGTDEESGHRLEDLESVRGDR